MAVHRIDHHDAVSEHGIEVGGGGALGPEQVILPAARADGAVAGIGGLQRGQRGGKFFRRVGTGEIDAGFRQRARQAVHVAVDQAGQHQPPFGVDHLRAGADAAARLGIAAQRGDPAIGDAQALRHAAAIAGSALPIHGVDAGVEDHRVGGQRGCGRQKRGDDGLEHDENPLFSAKRGKSCRYCQPGKGRIGANWASVAASPRSRARNACSTMLACCSMP